MVTVCHGHHPREKIVADDLCRLFFRLQQKWENTQKIKVPSKTDEPTSEQWGDYSFFLTPGVFIE